MKALVNIWRRLAAPGSFVSRAIDPFLNGAIILMGILILVAFVRSYHLRSLTSGDVRKPSSNAQMGRQASLQGIDWSKSEHTLLMFLNTQCRYCQKSEPFYRRLSSEITDHQKARLIAFFPDPPEKARGYFDRAQIRVDEIRQPLAGDLTVKGTPTLILFDKNGIATKQWIGLLSPAEEADVLSHLGLDTLRKPKRN